MAAKRKTTRKKQTKSRETQTFFRSLKRILSGIGGAVLALALCICLQALGILDEDAIPALGELKQFFVSGGEPANAGISVSGDGAQVHVLDVGQGDSTLILCGDSAVLLDGGERDQGETVVSYLEAQGVDSLDLVIASHPHSDHIGGLIEVLKRVKVEEVVMPDLPEDQIPTTSVYEKFLNALEASGAQVTPAASGDTYKLDDGGVLEILGPAGTFDDLNDWSVSAKFVYGSTAFVVSADMEEPAEEALLATGIDLSADVLALSHHGSKTSNSEAYLDAVGADYYIAQVGYDNDYGHPHQQTVQRVKERDGILLRSDEDGTIVFTTDGQSLDVQTEK